jgi:hypothetical protein
LKEFRSHTEDERADDKREVEGASASGVEDPVEGCSKDEEGDEVQDFVVVEDIDLN